MQRGWKKSQEYLSGDYCVVNFTDDEWRVFTVMVRRVPFIEGMIITVSYVPGGMKSWIFKEDPEDNDMPGRDFNWLPRYPGANRTQSVEDYTGITHINYQIIDYNCIDCVKEFYKEHMLKDNWQLIGSNHKNKEEIEDISAKSMASTKEIFSQLGIDERLKDRNIDFDTYEEYFNTQDELPSEIYDFYFEKKDDACAIGISYKEAKEGLNPIEQQRNKFSEYLKELTEEQRKVINEESLQEELDKIRPYYYQSQSNKEAVMVSVVYMPKGSSYSSRSLEGRR